MDKLQASSEEVEALLQAQAKKRGRQGKQDKQKQFQPQWVKFPASWIKALRPCRSLNVYRLALVIHLEAFKRSHTGGEIVLSKETTGIPRSSRVRAVNELVKLGLVRVRKDGNHAIRIIKLRTR
jgi:hypothetical protein